MTLSNSILSYQDCLEAMDQAMADPQGGRVRFPDEAAALHFRARCHQVRILTRRKNAQVYEDPTHPQHNACEYDELVLKLKTDGKEWFIYLVRMAPGSITVEPLSTADEINHVPIVRERVELPTLVAEIVKRRVE